MTAKDTNQEETPKKDPELEAVKGFTEEVRAKNHIELTNALPRIMAYHNETESDILDIWDKCGIASRQQPDKGL